jgi:hypothetical protein
MFKKISLIFVLLFLMNCGFTPIHNIQNKNDISIKNLVFNGGDRNLNIFLKRNLDRYQNTNSSNAFIINSNIKYEKNIISKNAKGIATKYELKAVANFKIEYENNITNTSYKEIFTMDHIDDDFENKKYEKSIKENFANSIAKKLILKLSQIK